MTTENTLGRVAENPVPISKSNDIYDYIEKTYGDSFFILGERVVTPKNGERVKLIQVKMEDGRRLNLYFLTGYY